MTNIDFSHEKLSLLFMIGLAVYSAEPHEI